MRRILIALLAALALLVAAPAEAAKPPRPPSTTSYYFADETVVGADGVAVQRNFLAQVTTTSTTRTIKCTYAEQIPDPNQPGQYLNDPDGQYVGPYTGSLMPEDMKQECIARYAQRVV